MCNHVANWQWTLNPINQWPVLLKLKQIQKKYSKKKYKQWKLLHLERFISLGLVSKKFKDENWIIQALFKDSMQFSRLRQNSRTFQAKG